MYRIVRSQKNQRLINQFDFVKGLTNAFEASIVLMFPLATVVSTKAPNTSCGYVGISSAKTVSAAHCF